MNTGKKTSNAFLIAANLVPLVGVLFLGWNGKGIIVVYILETIIIGILNALKMLVVYLLNGTKSEAPSAPNSVSGWGIIPFFLFHYNFFIFVQSVLFFAFSSMWGPSNGPEPFNIIANFRLYINDNTLLALGSLLAANLAYFINDFILSGAYQKETLGGLMFQPYKRIFLQQFLVIFGGFIFMLTGGISIVMGLFVALKIIADYLTANYNNNPKVANWIKSKVTDGKKTGLTEEQKQMVENMFGRGKQ
jgi:hypothetical protein